VSAGGSPAALASRISASKRSRASRAGAPSSTAGARAAAGDSVAAAGDSVAAAEDTAAKDATAADMAGEYAAAEDAALAARYDAALRERGLVDIDDLVTLPVVLLNDDPSLAEAYRSRWTDVFVDEYQDVDEAQYRMLRLLTSPGSRICVIGDPDQAIYGFRGGDVGHFLRFAADYPDAESAQLTRSYRSAPTIVRAAMQLIRPGTLVPGRQLVPARTDIPDGPVVLHSVADERTEAEAIAATIETMLGGASFHALDSRAVDGRVRTEHQLSFADFAVLYRTTAQAGEVGEALGRRGFPFQRRSHSRLAEMPGVPEILGALTAHALSVPAVPVAEGLADAVRLALSEADGPEPADGAEIKAAIRAAADVLAPLAARCGTDLDRFLDEFALGAEVDSWDPRADRISLLTLHAAKGLEFRVVFIVGCEDGLLPLRPWHGAEVDYAEERRLLFVGMTRATTRLVLLTAAERSIHGAVTKCPPSPFLASVDPALLDRVGAQAPGRAHRRDKAQQARLF